MSGSLDAATFQARTIAILKSPDGTAANISGRVLTDQYLNRYDLVASTARPPYVIRCNGVPDTRTGNVVSIQITGGQLYQTAQSGGVWVADTAGNWTQTSIPTPPQPTPSGGFTVSNGRLVDAKGNPFRAKGVNVNYTQVWGNGAPDIGRVNRACLQHAFPGINFVRFACWGGALPPVGDAATVAWVSDLTANGIVVLMDLHYTGNAISPYDGTASAWFAGWSKQFAGNPMVWWDTQNEPHGSGISAMQAGQYNAIRSGGSTSPILLCCGDPGGELTGQNPADYASMHNVAFDMHYYGWMPSNGHPWSEVLGELAGYRSADGVIPVLCCETGDSTDGNTRDGNWQQVLASSLGNAAGFACWYMNWNSQGADLLLAAPFDGSALTDYGSLVRNAITSG